MSFTTRMTAQPQFPMKENADASFVNRLIDLQAMSLTRVCLATRAGGFEGIPMVGGDPLVGQGQRLVLAGCGRSLGDARRLNAVWPVLKCCHAWNMHHCTLHV